MNNDTRSIRWAFKYKRRLIDAFRILISLPLYAGTAGVQSSLNVSSKCFEIWNASLLSI